MDLSSPAFKHCVDHLRIESDRYYATVMVTICIKHHLEKSSSGTHFVSAEPIFHSRNNEEVNPDIALQCRDDRFGIVCEIKTSVSLSDQQLIKELESLKKYCQPLIGWDTTYGKIENHDVALLSYTEDADRLVNEFIECTTNGTLSFEKNVVICEWMSISGMKYGEEDVIIVRHKHGDSVCSDFNKMLKENLKCKVDDLTVDYERCKFTRKEPPIQYIMNQLWMDIFPSMTSPGKNFQTDVEEILKIASDYYITWSNIRSEFSQIRKRWIIKAMEQFCRIGLARRKKGSPNEFEILYSKKVPKDIKKYIMEQLCASSSGESRPLEDELGPKTLDEFV